MISQAFERYFQNKGHETGSVLVQTRYKTSVNHNIFLADIARYEVGGAIAILVNTAPALFWMLFCVFSNPGILEDCRQEIQTILVTKYQPNGTLLRSLDVTKMKAKCPGPAFNISGSSAPQGTWHFVPKSDAGYFTDDQYFFEKRQHHSYAQYCCAQRFYRFGPERAKLRSQALRQR